MLKMATAALALSLLTLPQAIARQSVTSIAASDIDPRVIGLPIHSADNQLIGVVKQAGIGDGEPVLIGEVARPLGLGPDLVAIPPNMYVHKGDHIELTLTAEQVQEKLEHNRGR